MRISTKGRGIIKAQQGTVARPNPKENKDNPDRVNVQQQGFRGANVNMKDANGNYYIDPNRQLKGTDIHEKGIKPDVEVIMEAARQRVLLQHPQHPQQTTPWMKTEK